MALFAMCAMRRANRSRTHRKMRDVCATRAGGMVSECNSLLSSRCEDVLRQISRRL